MSKYKIWRNNFRCLSLDSSVDEFVIATMWIWIFNTPKCIYLEFNSTPLFESLKLNLLFRVNDSFGWFQPLIQYSTSIREYKPMSTDITIFTHKGIITEVAGFSQLHKRISKLLLIVLPLHTNFSMSPRISDIYENLIVPLKYVFFLLQLFSFWTRRWEN